MSSILFEIKSGVAVISLNRPEKFNAFTREMALHLQDRLDQCESDKNVRSIYITGIGKAFSAGQDLTEITDPAGLGMAKILDEYLYVTITRDE